MLKEIIESLSHIKIATTEVKYGSKKSITIKINGDISIILKDFTNTNKNVWKSKKTYLAEGAKWSIFIDADTNAVWGVSGDYSFGKIPSYYNIKYFGNIKAAKQVFEMFIEEYSSTNS